MRHVDRYHKTKRWSVSAPICIAMLTTFFVLIWKYFSFQFCHLDAFFGPLLAQLVTLFNEKNIKCWPDWGAMIGLIRERNLLPWDYDLDLSVLSEDMPKLFDAIPDLEALGLEATFIHQISPALYKFYTAPQFWRFGIRHPIEFREYITISVKEARQRKFVLPRNAVKEGLSNDTLIVCNDVNYATDDSDSDNETRGDHCMLKDRVLPLQKWSDNDLGITFWMPKDAEYALYQIYGANWKAPYIKGWKSWACVDRWTIENKMQLGAFIVSWYCVLIGWWLRQKYGFCRTTSDLTSEPLSKQL